MRREYGPCLVVLTLLLTASLWNGRCLLRRTERWEDQLLRVEALALPGDAAAFRGDALALRGGAAAEALNESFRDFQASRMYLHVVCRHDAVDGAEALYRRCTALWAAGERGAFMAELSDLQEQIAALADMERLSLENIL